MVFFIWSDRMLGKRSLTRLARKMCKVGKVGGSGSLGGRSGEDVSAQVGQQVKLLLLSGVVSLGTR